MPWLEARTLWRLRRNPLEAERILHQRNLQFQAAIPEAELKAADVVIGYDTSSWVLARRVRELGRTFILDQSIGHSQEKELVFRALRERFPAWLTTLPHKEEGFLREEAEEHELADRIVAPSRFVAAGLVGHGVSRDKIAVIPFGTDLLQFRPASVPPPASPLRFLYVGGLSARKGVPLLLEAWRRLRPENAELWLVGPGQLPQAEQLIGGLDRVRFFGRRTPAEVASISRECHVFVFPSYFEGLAQVQIEAAAAGLPVIGTESSGAADIVRHGESGLVLPTGDIGALVAAMRALLQSPDKVSAMRRHAVSARDQLSWQVYGDKWARLIAAAVMSATKGRA